MTNLNEHNSSTEGLDVINEISEKVADKIKEQQHSTEIKKLQEELQ